MHLFSKPEQVIDGYVKGVRKRYFNPFSYLLVSITLAGISYYFLKDIAMQSIGGSNTTGNNFENQKFLEELMNLVFDYQAFFTAIIIPVYALISWVVFLNKKKYNYFEHIIIYIYASAQISILNFLVATPMFFIQQDIANVISLLISSLSIFYNTYILIRIFKLTFIQFIVKFLYFIFIGIIIYLISSLIVFAGMLFFLGPGYFKQFVPPGKKDSIQKVQPIDSTKVINENNSKLKESQTISFYEAVSKLNCLS